MKKNIHHSYWVLVIIYLFGVVLIFLLTKGSSSLNEEINLKYSQLENRNSAISELQRKRGEFIIQTFFADTGLMTTNLQMPEPDFEAKKPEIAKKYTTGEISKKEYINYRLDYYNSTISAIDASRREISSQIIEMKSSDNRPVWIFVLNIIFTPLSILVAIFTEKYLSHVFKNVE